MFLTKITRRPAAIPARLKSLREKLTAHQTDALLVSCDENVRYLSGFSGGESFLLVLRREALLLTDFRYLEQAHNETGGLLKVVERADSAYTALIRDQCLRHGVKRLGFESNRMGFEFWDALRSALQPKVSLQPCRGWVDEMRMIKTEAELAVMRRAVEITRQTYQKCTRRIRPGVTEREIQAQIEFVSKRLGSEKPAFDIIVACGKKSSMPHAVTGDPKVSVNDLVLMDMGMVHEGYHTDLTRCFFVGRIPPLQRKIYEIVLEAQTRAIAVIRDGIQASGVDEAARGHIQKSGYGKWFGHSTGHGVGLEIHEPPSVSSKNPKVLKEGMVVTVEPGIYLPGQFGVRIEDMVLVKKEGCEVLTDGIPKHRFK